MTTGVAGSSPELALSGSGPPMDAEKFLVHHEALCIAAAALDPTESEDSAEGLVVPPSTVDLRGKAVVQEVDLLSDDCFVESDVVRYPSEVTIPLWDLVVQDESVAPDGRDHLGDEAVILMSVVGAWGEHEVRMAVSAPRPRVAVSPLPIVPGSRPSGRSCKW